MKYIILCGGFGKRLHETASFPKPLNHVLGVHSLKYILDSIPSDEIYIILNKNLKDYNIDTVLPHVVKKKYTCVYLERATRGPVETAYLGLQQLGISENEQVCFFDNDTIYDLNSGNYTLSIYDSITESIQFSVENTVINAVLNIPLTTVYLGNSYIIPVLNIYSAYDYVEWDFGDGNFAQNDINPVHYYTQAGVYTLRATVGAGQCSKIFETQITVDGTLTTNFQYRDLPKYRPATFYYAIDGKLVKRQ